MRTLLLAASLAPLLSAQVVEESFALDPGPLDFIRGEGLEQAILQNLSGDALVGLDAEGRVVPRLADRWEERAGFLRLHLRSGVRFTDGAAVRGTDALWTFREIQRDTGASPTKRALLEGCEARGSGAWIEIRSPKPAQRVLMELARIPVAREGHPGTGSGPFALRREGAEWHFTARSHFLAPRISGLHFRLIPDAQAALQNLQKGWLTLGVPPARPGLKPPPSHREIVEPVHAQFVVWSREGLTPLKALERWRGEAYPEGYFAPKARPSRGLWPETLGFEAQPIRGTAPHLAGSFTCLYAAGDELAQRALLALGARAAKEGVTLEPRPVEPALLYERLQKGDFQLACALVVYDPSPWSVLEYLDPKGPMNFTGWSHPALKAVVPQLQKASGAPWRTLQALWAEAPAALPILDLTSVVWVDRRLRVLPSALGLYQTTPGAAGWTWAP